jgi:hypothetical protein
MYTGMFGYFLAFIFKEFPIGFHFNAVGADVPAKGGTLHFTYCFFGNRNGLVNNSEAYKKHHDTGNAG